MLNSSTCPAAASSVAVTNAAAAAAATAAAAAAAAAAEALANARRQLSLSGSRHVTSQEALWHLERAAAELDRADELCVMIPMRSNYWCHFCV
jgi:uncharacterized protein YbaP (TraB family)